MPDVAKKSALEPHHIRSLALAGAVVGVVLLPIAAAQANPDPTGSSYAAGSGQSSAQSPTQSSSPSSAQPTATPTAAQALGAEYCGATTSTGVGAAAIQAQACVEQSDGAVSAKVYVSNGSATDQTVALNLTRTDGSVVQVQCTVAAADTSGSCETAALPTTGGTGAYNAIAELIAANQPVSAGVLHTESGLVAPAAGDSGSVAAQ
jgi:hypothetical protein